MNDGLIRDDEAYPVEASAGSDNAYYVEQCTIVGHKPAYAACLRKIQKVQGGSNDAPVECVGAIGWKTCSALALRNIELSKGRAVFYIPRTKLQTIMRSQEELSAPKAANLLASMSNRDERKRRQREAVTEQKPTKPTVAPPAKEPDLLAGVGDSYAAAINRAIQAESSQSPSAQESAPTPSSVEPTTAKPGESLIELARRMRQQQAAA